MKPIELYSMATPNGQKIGIALEEMGLSYHPHLVDITKGEQHKPEFLEINPNGKIPAIIDPEGNDGTPLSIFESGAILLHLAHKSKKFIPEHPKEYSEILQWLFFQVGNVGPMFGQFGHFFKYAADKCDHPYPLERYRLETKRLLNVIDKYLEGKTFLVGEQYTIADMAIVPWVNGLRVFYKAEEILGLGAYTNVNAWVNAILDRPRTQAGMKVCSL